MPYGPSWFLGQKGKQTFYFLGLMQIQCFYLEGTGYLHTISVISHHKTLYLLVINNVDTSFFLTLKHV